VVFAEPPGLEGILLVGAEHGDIVIHADLAGRPFCAFVLTADDALTLSMWLCAHRRRTPPPSSAVRSHGVNTTRALA
jgi:hypothetical protein